MPSCATTSMFEVGSANHVMVPSDMGAESMHKVDVEWDLTHPQVVILLADNKRPKEEVNRLKDQIMWLTSHSTIALYDGPLD